MRHIRLGNVSCSDDASELMSRVASEIQTKMIEEMDFNTTDELRTPGFVNCALVLKELIKNENTLYFTMGEKWLSIWTKLDAAFEQNHWIDQWISSEDIIYDYHELHAFVKEMLEESDANQYG